MDLTKLLRTLSEASGVSGYEHEIRALASDALRPYVDEMREDALGNLIALKRGSRKGGAPARSIMLAAHTDEIGLMVSGFEGQFLRFATVGGIDLRTIVGQEVTVHTRDGALPGIIATRPPHVVSPEARRAAIPLEELYIDIGLEEDQVTERVSVGDLVTMRRDFVELLGDYVSGKAFDDRAGVVSIVRCMELLAGWSHEWDVYAVATSQEEVGLRGSTTSAYGVDPDIAIAIDVTFGSQAGVSDDESVKMGDGPAIGRGPNMHPLLAKRMVDTAREHELPYQVEIMGGRSGTDGWAIQVTREGVPTALLSIPLRYMHTTVETLSVKDVERTARLMALFIAGLDAEIARELGL